VTVFGNRGDAPQEQRVVYQEQVGAEFDGFIDGLGHRVHGQMDRCDGCLRLTHEESGSVPGFRPAQRPQPFDDGVDFCDCCGHLDSLATRHRQLPVASCRRMVGMLTESATTSANASATSTPKSEEPSSPSDGMPTSASRYPCQDSQLADAVVKPYPTAL